MNSSNSFESKVDVLSDSDENHMSTKAYEIYKQEENDKIVISVEDNGTGIRKND